MAQEVAFCPVQCLLWSEYGGVHQTSTVIVPLDCDWPVWRTARNIKRGYLVSSTVVGCNSPRDGQETRVREAQCGFTCRIAGIKQSAQA